MAAEPDKPELRLELARLYAERGLPEVALEHYRLAGARFPERADIALAMARALRQLGLHANAEQSLTEFLKARPQTGPECVSWLGILLDELGRWKEGEESHRAALQLAPSVDYLHNNLG